MKTQEKLKELKQEYETLNNKLKELSDDELKMVTGGGPNIPPMPSPSSRKKDYFPLIYIFNCRKCGNVWQHSFDPEDSGELSSYCPNCHELSNESIGVVDN